jgi:autotransporter-associated beta strand protein
VGNTATNTYFTGNVIVRPATRLEIATTNGMLGTNITAEYDGGSGIPSSFYAHAGATFTNTQSISIIGQGPGTGVDQPRGFGALRLNNVWTGPITIAGVDLNFLNTTIGGASGTGTILGNISDGGNSYMLEYFGGTIQVGPTTGVNTYGVTRISEALTGGAPGTSGNTIVVALNNNAFSTNNLEMVGQATLRVNGNNIAFPTVTIPYAGVTNFVPVIQNNSTNSAGTITLGGDGSSWQFDGVFGDGTGQPLNLTKVGSGTLTLSGDSTNTGTVAVNQGVLALIEADAPAPAAPKHGYGTFSNATLITVASGATLDVTARPAGTLSLNSGQTLGGNGTLSGTVDALAGSAVAPGSSVGTLTISGGLTLNGTLLMELNRTNGLQTNDLITVSGSFTSTGGALFVTNTGPALAAGNFFQLFGGGRSFASVTLQTNDAANNKTYVWNNTVASNGRITVQNVGTFVNPAPTNITFKVNGPNLELSWPADHTGWRLQAQTNSRTAGVKTNWADVQGSTLVNSVTNAIDKNNGTVFYRMVYP